MPFACTLVLQSGSALQQLKAEDAVMTEALGQAPQQITLALGSLNTVRHKMPAGDSACQHIMSCVTELVFMVTSFVFVHSVWLMYLVHAARTVKATNKTACASFDVSLSTMIVLSTHE